MSLQAIRRDWFFIAWRTEDGGKQNQHENERQARQANADTLHAFDHPHPTRCLQERLTEV
jgi:hypothetical protein